MRNFTKFQSNRGFGLAKSLSKFSCVNLKIDNVKRMCPMQGQSI